MGDCDSLLQPASIGRKNEAGATLVGDPRVRIGLGERGRCLDYMGSVPVSFQGLPSQVMEPAKVPVAVTPEPTVQEPL